MMEKFFNKLKKYESPDIFLMSVSDDDVITTSGNTEEDDGDDNDYMGEWDPL